MLFTEFRFLCLFAAAFALVWSTPNHRLRKVWLLAASYAFYSAWNWRFLSLILISTVVDYWVGRTLARTRDPGRRRNWLAVSLVCNLGLLGAFKYFDFFAGSAARFLGSLGFEAHPWTLNVILPVGISFYTFQTLSYTIDIYRERLKPVESPLDFALFVAFFPQLVAGPIVRAAEFLPQLATKPRFADVDVRAALSLFLVGFVKKACLSDNVAPVVDRVFSGEEALSAASHWLGAVLYTLQIYCDFSGYSDMAIATAALLGYRLVLNFDFPYLAKSLQDFWRRWHISLSSWFRDYLYLPLGGNRGGSWRTYRNLVAVFFLCGLWHGAGWTFVVWGLYHGFFLILERTGFGQLLERIPRATRHLYLLTVVLIGWIPFRAATLTDAGEFVGRMLGFGAGSIGVEHAGLWWGLAIVALAVHGLVRRGLFQRLERLPNSTFGFAYGVTVALVLPWVATEYQPFLYFQF